MIKTKKEQSEDGWMSEHILWLNLWKKDSEGDNLFGYSKLAQLSSTAKKRKKGKHETLKNRLKSVANQSVPKRFMYEKLLNWYNPTSTFKI